MYNLSEEELKLFRGCYRQTALIKVSGVPGLTCITDSDILMNGLTVDRYCFSSGTLEIGTAIASELSLTLDNHTGKFDNYDFDGATLSVHIGISKWDAKAWEKAVIHYIPMGIFTIDEISKGTSTIVLNALDNMVRFDKPYDTELSYPATLDEILQDACAKCGVQQYTTRFLNSSYRVEKKPVGDLLTYRQIVQWVAELAAANAWIDWNGALRLGWFENTGLTVSGADRYSSDEEEYSVTITGVKVTASESNAAVAGEAGWVLNVEGNDLVQSGVNNLAQSIYAVVGGFSYLPYSCTTRPSPFLYPMDIITYIDGKRESHATIVSAVTYVINGNTKLTGEGMGGTKGKYAQDAGSTKQEKIAMDRAKESLIHLNQVISGAFGLYQTAQTENGATVYYFHDKPSLVESQIIYTFTSGGFAWTDSWNNGNPEWKYGFTKDGNALYHILSAYKIQTEYLEAGCITAEKIQTGAIGGFTVDENHIGIGKTAFNDPDHDGVYISPDGIGLGKGKFQVDKYGQMVASDVVLSGKITAKEGQIGSWVIDNHETIDLTTGQTGQVSILRSTVGVPGRYRYEKNLTVYTTEGWAYQALLPNGLQYILMNPEPFDDDNIVAIAPSMTRVGDMTSAT